jgi:hypothetical protein
MRRRNSHDSADDSVAAALDRLREELAVVRQVLDEIHDELQWANRSYPADEGAAPPYRRITSMPLDPTVPDWAEQLNRYSPADLPIDDPAPACDQGRLF